MASIDPALWGNSVWASMHWTAAGYPPNPTPQEKMHYKACFEMLQHTLPCTECREHYSALLTQMPIDPFLVSGKQLRQWVTSLHNTVNARTGNLQRWTLEQVDARYPPAEPEVVVAPEPLTVPRLQPLASTQPREQQQPQIHYPPPQIVNRPPVISAAAANLQSLRQQQKIMQNNARMMGRVHKVQPVSSGAVRSLRRAGGPRLRPTVPTTVTAPAALPAKKKGCGCKNKRK